jgi:hypothetical protein
VRKWCQEKNATCRDNFSRLSICSGGISGATVLFCFASGKSAKPSAFEKYF